MFIYLFFLLNKPNYYLKVFFLIFEIIIIVLPEQILS